MRSFSRVSLAVAASAVLVGSLAFPATAANDTTETTVVIAAGSLAVVAPDAAALTALTPGRTASADISGVEVIDSRAGVANWAASVVLTDFVGSATGDTIPAANAKYTTGTATKEGTVTLTPASVPSLSATQYATVQSATAVTGNNKAMWNAVVEVSAPTDALADTYTATLTHSVL